MSTALRPFGKLRVTLTRTQKQFLIWCVLRKKIHSEGEALALLTKSKEEGLHYFFERYYPPVCYFVARLVDDVTIAEEITADVFIKFWNKRAELSSTGSVKALLYLMARNTALDYLRKQKRMAVHQAGLHYFSPTAEKNILQTLVETETIKQIITTLQQLPPRCSEVFKLAYVFGKTDKEIAAALKLSPHTVRNQKLRAVRLLREKIILLPAFLAAIGLQV